MLGESDPGQELHLVDLWDAPASSELCHQNRKALFHLIHAVQQNGLRHGAHLRRRGLQES